MKTKCRGHSPYCDKSTCEYWDRCTLALTERTRSKLKGEPEIKEHRACYKKKEFEL